MRETAGGRRPPVTRQPFARVLQIARARCGQVGGAEGPQRFALRSVGGLAGVPKSRSLCASSPSSGRNAQAAARWGRSAAQKGARLVPGWTIRARTCRRDHRVHSRPRLREAWGAKPRGGRATGRRRGGRGSAGASAGAWPAPPGARPRTASGRSCAASTALSPAMRTAALAPQLAAQHPLRAPSTCGGRATSVARDRGAVAGPARRRAPRRRRRRSPRRRAMPAVERLADALAGHRVGGARRRRRRTGRARRRAPTGRSGPGSARPCAVPRERGVGPERRPTCGRPAARATCAFMSATVRRPRSRRMPKPTLARRRAAGTTRRSRAAGRARTTPTGARRAEPVTPVAYWRKACHSPR